MRAQIPSTARLLRGAFILVAVRPQPHSIKILFGAAEPPSPRLNSIAQILPSAKAEDEPPPLCLNFAATTDRRPARDRLRAHYRTDRQQAGYKPAARQSKRSSKTDENDRRQTCRRTKGSLKQTNRGSTRSVVGLVSKPLGTPNEQAD